jgi:hypothetical protein
MPEKYFNYTTTASSLIPLFKDMLNHLMADNEVSVLTSEEVTSQMADV